MNREIKFRAWDKSELYMLDAMTMEELMAREAINRDVLINLIFLQYTGLHDKNGKEIYEGDILETPYEYPSNDYIDEPGDSGIYRGEVHYRPSKGFIQIHCFYKSDEFCEHGKRGDLEIRSTKCNVIGNIYENPELLEQP